MFVVFESWSVKYPNATILSIYPREILESSVNRDISTRHFLGYFNCYLIKTMSTSKNSPWNLLTSWHFIDQKERFQILLWVFYCLYTGNLYNPLHILTRNNDRLYILWQVDYTKSHSEKNQRDRGGVAGFNTKFLKIFSYHDWTINLCIVV